MKLCVRVIGMPAETDWPSDVPVPWSSFKITRRYSLEQLVPSIEPAALELLEVKCQHICLHLCACQPGSGKY